MTIKANHGIQKTKSWVEWEGGEYPYMSFVFLFI